MRSQTQKTPKSRNIFCGQSENENDFPLVNSIPPLLTDRMTHETSHPH